MAKGVISHDRYLRMVRESEALAEMLKSEGWKIIESEITQRSAKIQELLVENRLRTVSETVNLKDGTKTFTTTAESQIAENAGQYKMAQWIFTTIEGIISAPTKAIKAEEQGQITIEKADSGTKVVDQNLPTKPTPHWFEKAKRRISTAIKRR